MRRHSSVRRLVSLAIAVAMMMPALASAAEAAVATWLAPPAGQTIAARNVEVSVGYNTQSDLQVTKLELYIDGRYYAGKTLVMPQSRGVNSFWWDTAKSSRGVHQLSVKIFAGKDLVATVTGTGTIGATSYDLRAPSVRFANVNSGDVLAGVTNIKMKVNDDSAEPPIVSLLVDNVLKMLTNREPYAYSLDTAKYTDGDHELQTYAYDSSGNKSDPAIVKVAFKNGLEKPVVAAIAVDKNPTSVAPSEDDGVGELTVSIPEPSAAKASVAARAVDPTASVSVTGAPASPVARPTSAKSIRAAAPKSAHVAKPATVDVVISSTPKMAESSAKPVAKQHAPATQSRVALATVPAAKQIAKPSASLPKIASAPVAPELKSAVRSSSPKNAVVAMEPSLRHSTPVAKHIAAPVAAKPSTSISPTASVSTRTSTHRAAIARASGVMPVTIEPAREASAGRVPVSVAPVGKVARPTVQPVHGSAVKPSTRISPDVAVAKPVAVSASPSVRVARLADASPSPSAVRPVVISAPDAADPSVVASAPGVAGIRTSKDNARIAEGTPQAPTVALDEARAANPKPVRVAMLPTLRNGDNTSCAQSQILCRPPVAKDVNAKLEKKKIVVAKGKMKIRDLFDQLGGVVFWDSATHSVIAYAQDVKLEVTIGSRVMKVNGVATSLQAAPRLVDGRTIIDASLCNQICQLLGSGRLSAAGDAQF